ncbi:MAG: hypothetical protein AB2693_33475 [Candidatus Thiodiazotropha sp.]
MNRESFHEGIPSELALFDLPPTLTAVQDAYFAEIRPLSQISNDVPIEFRIAASNTLDYLDLYGSQIYVKLKITKSDGSSLDGSSKVGPANLFLQSLFSTVEVTLQNKVTLTCSNNPYRAMIQTLLNYGSDAETSQLTTMLFNKDSSEAIDDCDTTGSNDGLVERTSYVSLSKFLDMQGGLYHDFFQMKRYLLNQVDVKVKLYRSTPAFCLLSNTPSADFKIDISDVCLLARKIKVNPAVIVAHSEMLNTTNAKYPFTRTDCRMQSIPQGSSSFHWDNLFQGQKPDRVVVCFVDSAAVSGQFGKNPFNFQNCGIKHITLFADGMPTSGAPSKLTFNPTKGSTFVRAYTDLFQNYGKWKNNSGNNISREDFENGYCLFTFQLQPYFDNRDDYLFLLKTANVRLDVEFSQALTKTLTCIVYSENSAIFEINKERDILAE